MQPIKDNQAKKLSGGHKRKLSIGFAVLGDPKVHMRRREVECNTCTRSSALLIF